MSPIRKLLQDALQRPLKERALLASRLVSSLNASRDKDVERAWQREIRKRLAEANKNEIAFVSWEEVRQQLKRNLSAAS